MTTIRLTEEDCANCTWTLVEQTADYRRYIGHGTHPKTGAPITVQKTEALIEPHLLKMNEEERNDASGRSWSFGSGSDKGGNMPLVPVGRIPLNKFFAEIAPYMKDGDTDQFKWWLSQDKNKPFRTRDGGL